MLKKLGLNVLHYSGSKRLFGSAFAGQGSVLTLHHVCPQKRSDGFAPNSILNITPQFLEESILRIRDAGFEFIHIAEINKRLQRRESGKRFVVITLDDGYRDNYSYAYPVFLKHRVPFCIYLCTGILDGSATLWWRDLEEIIRQSENVRFPAPGSEIVDYPVRTIRQKNSVFRRIYWQIRKLPQQEQLDVVRRLVLLNPVTINTEHDAPLDVAMIREMLESGLLTAGAHTINHYALSKLSESEVLREIDESRTAIANMTGVVPEHFAYPFGDAGSAAQREFDIVKKLGFRTAVTTRKGVIQQKHLASMHALPRISLNGAYQKRKYLDLFLSGLPFALYDRVISTAD